MKKPKQYQPSKPTPNTWGRSEPTDRKNLSIRHERRLAEESGLTPTAGSGNQPWASKKGDFSHPDFVFEAKRTKFAAIDIDSVVLVKLLREAYAVGKDPALILTMEGAPENIPQDWAAVPLSVFMSLLGVNDE